MKQFCWGIRAVSLVAPVLLALVAGPARADLRLGIAEYRGFAPTMAQWQPLADYLTGALGQPVTVTLVNETKFDEAFGKKEMDVALVNPLVGAVIYGNYGAEPLASFVQPWGSQFAGVIFSSATSGIKTLADLKGKKLAITNAASAGAYLYPRYHLFQKNFVWPTDFSEIKEILRQDDIVFAVKSGLYDAGSVRTGILEDMVQKGKVQMSDFTVLDAVAPTADFPFVRTTALAPEWYVMQSKECDPALAAKVKTALLALKSDSPAAQAGKIKGFQEPLPISAMVVQMKALKMAPFDK